MSNGNLLKDLKELVKKHALSEPSFVYNDCFHEIKFTLQGEALIEKMFTEGKPMNCIPGCTIRICVKNETVRVSVWHESSEIGTFRTIGTAMDTTYNFEGVPVQLNMDSF